MKVIDLDSHSRPRPEDYIVEAQYSHLRPRSYADSKGTIRHLFNDKILSISTAGEQANAHNSTQIGELPITMVQFDTSKSQKPA
jgi:hypothetical protein